MKQPLNTRILTRAVTVLTCAVCTVGLTTGCSQDLKVDSVVSTSATSRDDHLLEMAECVRDEGVDIPDPDANDNVQFPGNEVVTKTIQEYKQVVGPAPGTEDFTKPETQQDLVKATECLRKEGYDVSDPEAGEGIQLSRDTPQDVMNKCFSQVGGK